MFLNSVALMISLCRISRLGIERNMGGMSAVVLLSLLCFPSFLNLYVAPFLLIGDVDGLPSFDPEINLEATAVPSSSTISVP